ncbi:MULTISPECIES: hypothetical protein [unclassified Spiroplasma]|uniref:hypothetical protein n=1 Tax=unclassified Spiroplasma TaxID=2637901 RepID=UPI0030CFCB62
MMQVNLFEIDYLQLCFSDLGSEYCYDANNEDIILYKDEVQVDKLRINYQQVKLDKEWESFKLKIIDTAAASKVYQACQNLNFKIANKIKVFCKLKPQGKMISRCVASISQVSASDRVSFDGIM